jgi:hypothetical protein
MNSTLLLKGEIKLTIVDFFDPKNIEHLIAFREMQNTGIWPRWFWDWVEKNECEIPPMWHLMIAMKITNEYIKEKLDLK